MSRFKAYVTGAAAALASTLVLATGASAQTALTNGATLTPGAQSQTTYNSIDLGASAGTGFASQMPMSLSYAGTNLNITFAASSGVIHSGNSFNPTPGSNFIGAIGTQGAVFTFSSVQRYFGFQWGTPGDANSLQFYNGQTLLASLGGADFRAAANVGNTMAGRYAGFSFSELGFDRVVMASGPASGFEAGNLRFNDTVDVVPIPLGGVGGIVALLGMFALRRGQGGRLPQRLLAFASLAPRRKHLQRFA